MIIPYLRNLDINTVTDMRNCFRIANRIGTIYPCRVKKRSSLKCLGNQLQEIPEKDWRVQQLKQIINIRNIKFSKKGNVSILRRIN